jgi:uncharacterized sulfatase
VWKRLFDEGKLTPQQARFWQTKPPEELYDLQNDPDEVNNLADSPAHQEALQRLRKAQQDCALETRDIGFLPEAEMHRRTQNSTPYEVAHDDRQYPLQRIMAMAETASFMKTEALEEIKKGFQDSDSGVRFWAALGILMRGKSGAQSARNELLKALDDESPSVRIVAAQALAQDGDDADMQKALPVLSDLAHHDKHGVYVALEALNAIDALGPKAASAVADVKALARNTAKQDARAAPGIRNLVDHILGNLQ